MTGESIGETIYYKDEVGLKSGTLQMISYRFSSVGTSHSNIPVKIWVGETELEDLSETSIPADEMTWGLMEPLCHTRRRRVDIPADYPLFV